MSTIVTQPNATTSHFARPLTDFAVNWGNEQNYFVAGDAFSLRSVRKQQDRFYKYNRADLLRNTAHLRADGTEARISEFSLSTDVYDIQVYSTASVISDRTLLNQDEVLDLATSKTRHVTEQLLIDREQRMVSELLTTGIWGTDWTGIDGASPNTTQFTRWNSASSNPIKVIRDAIRHVHSRTGKRPNRMLIGRTAFDALKDNSSVLDRITGGSMVSNPANVEKNLLASLFSLEQIHVMDAVANTGPAGGDEDTDLIGGNDVLIYYAPASVGRDTATSVVLFAWTAFAGTGNNGLFIRRFRQEASMADVIEGNMAYQFKVVANELGIFLNGVI